MYLWLLSWLYFRLEFMIDCGTQGYPLCIDLIPSTSLEIGPKDQDGYRYIGVSASFLVFCITFSYYMPSLYILDGNGEIVGKRLIPEFTISQV